MQLGMIGLGRMGASLVRRLARDGHRCVVYDVNAAAVKKLAGRGVRGAVSIDALIAKLTRPRAVPVLSAALYERFSSRGGADFANRVLSAVRKQFGGHDERKKARR